MRNAIELADVRRSWLIGCVVLLTCSSMVFAASHPDGSQQSASQEELANASRQIDAANGMLSRGLYDLAESEYRAALLANGDDATKTSAQYGLAICLYRQNRFDETITALAPLIKNESFAYGAEVGIMQGQSLLAVGRFEEAVLSFKDVATKHGDHKLASQAIVGVIESLYRSGSNAEAVKFSRKMTDRIAHEGARNRAELLQAAALINIQDAAEASAILTHLLTRDLDPSVTAQVTVMLGQCAAQVGRFADAAKRFKEVLAGDAPGRETDARMGLADALYRLGKLEESRREIKTLLDAKMDDPLRAEATLLLGRIHFDEGAFGQARKVFEIVREIGNANRAEAEYWIAKCALRMGSAREAVELFDQWNKVHDDHPMNVEATYDHAVSLIETEQFDAASAVLRNFRTRFPSHELSPAALHLLAVAAFRQGNDADCTQLCELYAREFKEGPQLADVFSLAGRSTFRAEEWKQSIDWNSRFAAKFSGDARTSDANFRAGLASFRLDEFESAEQFFVKLLIDRQMPDAYAVASLAMGDIRFQAKDWPAADRWLSRFLEADVAVPSGDEALLKRGIARRKMNELAKALADFDTLLKRWPKSTNCAVALLQRGEILALQGDQKAAKVAFAKAAESNGGKTISTQATFQQAILAMQGGQYAEAAKYLTSFVASEPDDTRRAEALYQRGQCWLATGDFAKAHADFSEVGSKHGEHDRAAESAAWSFVALVRLNKISDAMALWSEQLSSMVPQLDGPTRATILYERAWALSATGESDAAAKVYAQVLTQTEVDPATRAHAVLGLAEIEIERNGCATGPQRLASLIESEVGAANVPSAVRERALFRSGLCALEAEHWSEAHELFAKLLEAFPGNPNTASIHLYSGEALSKLGRHSEAREQFERVTSPCDDPEICSAAMLRLGECLAALQQWALSERVLQDYLSRFAKSDVWFQAQFGLAWAREHQDRHDDAIKAYRDVVDRHRGPTAARAQFQIGECLFAKGEHEAAVREFLKVDILYDYPRWSAAALYESGRCFELMDRRVDARKQFKAVIDRFGDSKWAASAADRLPRLAVSVVPGH